MAVEIGRTAELAHQHHGAVRKIVGQQRRGVAAVVDLAVLGLPYAVAAPEVEGHGLQHIVLWERTRSSLTRTRSEMLMALPNLFTRFLHANRTHFA